jgi:hypothetical protein
MVGCEMFGFNRCLYSSICALYYDFIPIFQFGFHLLLALASQYFLVSPLRFLLVYQLLYGFDEDTHITGERRRLVFEQLFLVAIFMCIAFIPLVVAIMVAGRTDVGAMGITLMGINVVSFITIEAAIIH